VDAVTAYYNEFDPYAAAWLRNLIQAGLIAPGDVDERSIVDVRPDDLRGYTQVHFFAGIGGWSLAAHLAGWPDDKPLWTGSCPCQPFSAAGKRKGTADERHLWPVFAALIRECRPAVVAGEQVASKDGLGWLDGVCADLEAADYAWWAGDYCAAGVGAPHIRQRLWWLGHTDNAGPQGRYERRDGADQCAARAASLDGGLEHASGDGREQRRPEPSGRGAVGGCGEGERLADTNQQQLDRSGHAGPGGRREFADGGRVGFWSDYELVYCRGGTVRRTKPGVFPVAHGVSGRVGKLRAAGNAIVPQVAAEILRAYLEGSESL
jgi:DNA (cytosine-5)-methyltransferase 1